MNVNEIGKFIVLLRKENGLTQKELAEKINVTDKAISRWETGKGLPDISLWQSISDVLNISVNELLAGKRIELAEFSSEADKTLISTVDNAKKKAKSKIIVLSTIIIVLILFLCFFIPLATNATYFKSYYSTGIGDKQIVIPIPAHSFYRSTAGLGTWIIKLKTLKEHDEVEVFIDNYLSSLKQVEKNKKTLYYDESQNITIWQYNYTNDGFGHINTIYIGFNIGTPDEYTE